MDPIGTRSQEGIEREQGECAAALLSQQVGVRFVFNGTALAAENSDEFRKAMPNVLDKLRRLADARLLTIDESNPEAITAFDLRALEEYAAQDIREGIETLCDLQFETVDGEDPHENGRRHLRYRGPVTPSQLARLYRLMVKHNIKVQLEDGAKDASDLKARIDLGSVDSIDAGDIAKESAAERQRREEGQEASDLLSSMTRTRWTWNGLDVALDVPLDTMDHASMAALKELKRQGIVRFTIQTMRTPDGECIYTNLHIADVDLERLRMAAMPTYDEAKELLNVLFPPTQELVEGMDHFDTPWGRRGMCLQHVLPLGTDEAPDRQDLFESVLNELVRRGAVRFDLQRLPAVVFPLAQMERARAGEPPLDDRPQAMVNITRINIDALREAAKEMQAKGTIVRRGVDENLLAGAAGGRTESWTRRVTLSPSADGGMGFNV